MNTPPHLCFRAPGQLGSNRANEPGGNVALESVALHMSGKVPLWR